MAGRFAGLAAKVAGDPRIQRVLAKNMQNMDPRLAARIAAGDAEAALEAYQSIVAAGGRLPSRQMELPLSDDPRGLIPFGARGPGVPLGMSGPGVRVGGMGGPGVRGSQLVPSQSQSPAVLQPRGLVPVDAEFIPDGEIMVRPGRTPLEGEVIPRQIDRPYRQGMPAPGGPPSRTGRKVAAAAAAAGAGGVAVDLMYGPTGEKSVEGVTDTSGAADLHAEQSPPPSVQTPPEPTAEMYFAQARELIDRLNQMRRNAGGEVPEAPQIMAQVKRLQAMGDQLRNAPGYRPSDPGDPHQQAQMLIQDLNARRRQAGGEVPDAPQVMAEVRRLQAMGDQQQNSGYGRSGSFPQSYPRSA